MKKPLLALVTLCTCTAIICFADNGSASAQSRAANESDELAPKLTITNEEPNPSLLIPKNDVTEAAFAGIEPEVEFPSRGRFESVFDGRAAVGVMVDAKGNATDFLVIRYSKAYFANEVLTTIRNEQFTPRKIRGVAVSGRFYVVRAFTLSVQNPIDRNLPGMVSMNGMEQMSLMSDRIANSRDGAPLIYKAHGEHEIDGHLLKVAVVAAPSLPLGCEISAGHALKIVVSFYVDGGGDVRLPNVDSDASPLLIENVIKAVAGWKFERPTIKGEPALVFTNRTLVFEMPPRSTVP
jgi:outer membrane biosynthesis protein TonB